MKVKVIKKLMAYLLVGAMVISTPMTASATEASIADVYTSTDDADKSSGTGTLSSTMTGTHKFEDALNPEDPNREAQVIGLALDKTSLSLEVNGAISSDRLQARVLYSGYDPKDEQMVLAADAQTKEIIDKYLRWDVLGNEKQTVGISYYENTDGVTDPSMVNVRAKKGGQVTVRAYIDYNADGHRNNGEFYADAVVSVKELTSKIEFGTLPNPFYLNHTYNLNNYIKIEPVTAECEIGFSIAPKSNSDADKKAFKNVTVVINEKGEMTVKKVKEKTTVLLKAVTENGISAEAVEVTFDPGVKADGVEITGKNVLDFGKLTEKDDNKLNGRATILTADLTSKKESKDKITDIVEWSVKQGKTPMVKLVPVLDSTGKVTDRKIKVELLDNNTVGTATVTAKASSGKKKTYKITVNSTPSGVVVLDLEEAWTGAKPSLTAVLYADDCVTDKDGKVTTAGTVIPVGKTKLTYRALKGNATEPDEKATNIKNIKVSGKGVITSSNLLLDTDNKTPHKDGKDSRTIEVKAAFKDGNKPINMTAKCVVTVKQSNIKDITVNDVTHGGEGTPITFDAGKKKVDGTDVFYSLKTPLNAVSGGTYKFYARAYDDLAHTKHNSKLDEAITWATSSAKVGVVNADGQLSVLKGGSTNLTASYVTLSTNAKTGKVTAKLNKKTIKVKAVQKATSLTLNKNVFTAVASTDPRVAKPVSINVKKQLPSGSKDTITWKMITNQKDATTKTLSPVSAKNTTKVSVPVVGYPAGTVIKVGAYADGGAVAYAYIYVVDAKVNSVRIMHDGTKVSNVGKSGIQVGTKYTITPEIVVGSGKNAVSSSAVDYTKNNIGYETDPVTYSFNKAGIASVKRNEKGELEIWALKPGTTKLTVQTLSGKKAALTIKVVE